MITGTLHNEAKKWLHPFSIELISPAFVITIIIVNIIALHLSTSATTSQKRKYTRLCLPFLFFDYRVESWWTKRNFLLGFIEADEFFHIKILVLWKKHTFSVIECDRTSFKLHNNPTSIHTRFYFGNSQKNRKIHVSSCIFMYYNNLIIAACN